MSKMKYKLKDIYGTDYFYNCEDRGSAIECFYAENGDVLNE